jgi:hypothetical protein
VSDPTVVPQLAIFGMDSPLHSDDREILTEACRQAGWSSAFDYGHDASALLYWDPFDREIERIGRPMLRGTYAFDRGDDICIVGVPGSWRSLNQDLERAQSIDMDAPIEVIGEQVTRWLRGLIDRTPRSGSLDAAIEALFGRVSLLVTENHDLRRLLAAYAAEVEQTSSDLTEAQIEVRTLQALLAQIEAQNASLIKELNKQQPDPKSAGPTARMLRYLVPQLLAGVITVGATYVGTVAAMPDQEVQSLQTTNVTIIEHCDAVIEALPQHG